MRKGDYMKINSRANEIDRPTSLPAKRDERTTIAELARRPLNELEAGVALELDRIEAMSQDDPLSGLDEMIGLMQAINMELLKNQAPMLIESGHQRATMFTAQHKVGEMSRQESIALASMHRTQEVVVKLGAARAKVKDALVKRAHDDTRPMTEPAPKPVHQLPASTHVVIDIPDTKEPVGRRRTKNSFS